MNDEQSSLPQLDFNLKAYTRDEDGQIANIEDARAVIRNLYQIIQFLEVSAFAHLPLDTQSEIALYLVGTYLLTHNGGEQDPQYQEKIALLETLFDGKFHEMIKRSKETLNTEDILSSVEALFKKADH